MFSEILQAHKVRVDSFLLYHKLHNSNYFWVIIPANPFLKSESQQTSLSFVET